MEARVVVTAGDGVAVASWRLRADTVDVATIDGLARLQLALRRVGCSLRVQDTCPELTALLELVGLRDALAGPRHGPA